MSITESVEQILVQHQANGGMLPQEDWEQIARLFGIIPVFPNIPGPLFVPVHRTAATATNIEMVIVREGKVLLVKRTFLGNDGQLETAYHTPGTYIAQGEDFLQTAQRCADGELGVKVLSVHKLEGELNPKHPRFSNYSIGLLCKIEGEPKVGEWFDERPTMLEVQKNFWDLFIKQFVYRSDTWEIDHREFRH